MSALAFDQFEPSKYDEQAQVLLGFVPATPGASPDQVEESVVALMLSDDPTTATGCGLRIVSCLPFTPDVLRAFALPSSLPLGVLLGVHADDPAALRELMGGAKLTAPANGECGLATVSASSVTKCACHSGRASLEDHTMTTLQKATSLRRRAWDVIEKRAIDLQAQHPGWTINKAIDHVITKDDAGREALAVYLGASDLGGAPEWEQAALTKATRQPAGAPLPATPAWSDIEAAAEELRRRRPMLTKEQAIDDVCKARPDLMRRHAQQQAAAADPDERPHEVSDAGLPIPHVPAGQSTAAMLEARRLADADVTKDRRGQPLTIERRIDNVFKRRPDLLARHYDELAKAAR